MYISTKKFIKNWIKDIESCKEKTEYIYFARLQRVAEYRREKASKQFIKKHLQVGGTYQNKYNNKKYIWSGKYMQLLRKDGIISKNILLTVSITNFIEWQKIEK